MIEWIFSGIGSSLIVCWIQRRLARSPSLAESNIAPLGEMPTSSYAQGIGEKIRYIRAELLNLSLRQLSEFLEIEKVSQLERYELGLEEFPLPLLKKMEKYFSISAEFFDGVGTCVFTGFELCNQEVERYLSEGYKPFIYCSPHERGELFCRIVFEKQDGQFKKIVVAGLLCSFASKGGGRLNIQILINVIIARAGSYKDVRVLKVSSYAWECIRQGVFYNQDSLHRSADWEAQEVFVEWFNESEKANARWALA